MKKVFIFFGGLVCCGQVHASFEPTPRTATKLVWAGDTHLYRSSGDFYGDPESLFSTVQPSQKRVEREIDPSRSLYDAVRANNEEWVQTFISRKADLNEIGGDYERTPLYKAVLKRNKRIAALLLAAGADVNKKADLGSPLARAASKRDKEMVSLLLKYHAVLDQYAAFSPLSEAIEKGSKGIVRMLLAAGSDPNVFIDKSEKKTSLHTAVWIDGERKSRDITQILLAYGANTKRKDINGKTPLDLAVEIGAPELISLLTFGQTFIKNLKISLTTFAMAMHSRCGEKSPLQSLDQDFMHKIFSYLKPSVRMYSGPEVVHLCTMK